MVVRPATPKLHALGAALRKAREARGLGLRELARQLGDDASALSRYEKGERAPKPEKVSQILASLGVNGAEYEAVMALTRDTEGPLWVAVSLPEQQHQMDALLEFEENATQIIVVSPVMVPGLLQTREYAQGIIAADQDVPANQIRTRVTVRLGRKDNLTRPDNPVALVAMIGEAVLDQLIGSPAVMVGQLRSLLEMGQRENVTLRVVPKTSGWTPALEGVFLLIESHPMPVVLLETRRSALFLHEETDLATYRRAIDRIAQAALDPTDSAALITDHLTTWENTHDNQPPMAQVQPQLQRRHLR